MDYRAGRLKSLKLLFWGMVAIAVPLLIDFTLESLAHDPSSGLVWPAFFLTFLFFPFKWMSFLAGAISLIAAFDNWPSKPMPARSSTVADQRIKTLSAGTASAVHAPVSELV